MDNKQAQQKPYCYTYTENGEEYFAPPKAYVPDDAMPLFTFPPQRTWVGLTDEEIEKWPPEIHSVIRAIEKILEEKNNG
jgi:hypothetical protein